VCPGRRRAVPLRPAATAGTPAGRPRRSVPPSPAQPGNLANAGLRRAGL